MVDQWANLEWFSVWTRFIGHFVVELNHPFIHEGVRVTPLLVLGLIRPEDDQESAISELEHEFTLNDPLFSPRFQNN